MEQIKKKRDEVIVEMSLQKYTYARMINESPIKTIWKLKIGDEVFWKSTGDIDIIKDKDDLNFYNRKKDNWIPLPRQDQLQNIVTEGKDAWDLAQELVKKTCEWGIPILCASFEQLWLGFVMKKKYGAIWNDKNQKWITEIENKKTEGHYI